MSHDARVVLVLVCVLLFGNLSVIAQNTDCPENLPPRLTVGQQARVLPGLPNNVRILPRRNSTFLSEIPAGGVFTVIEGPTCADGYHWWSIDYNGFHGWTAEGEDSTYWLVPVIPDSPVLHPYNADQIVQKAVLSFGGTNDLDWSPDGKTIAMAGTYGVRLHDASNINAPPNYFFGHTNIAWSIAFSPDGKLLASGSGGYASEYASDYFTNTDNNVHLWDVATGRPFEALEGHQYAVTALAFSPDNKRIASGSYDGTIRIWDVATGEQLMLMKIPDWSSYEMYGLGFNEVKITTLSFNPDGSLLASGGDEGIARVWDTATGQEIKTLGEFLNGTGSSVAFSPDGNFLVTAGRTNEIGGGKVNFWNVNSFGQGEAERLFALDYAATSVGFNRDGTTLAVAADEVYLIDPQTGLQKDVFPTDKESQPIRKIIFSPNGSSLVTGGTYYSLDGIETVHIWDLQSGIDQIMTESSFSEARSIALSPQGSLIALAAEEPTKGIVYVWATDTGIQKYSFDIRARKVVFSPDSLLLAASSLVKDGNSLVWNMDTGNVVAALPAANDMIFTPDGTALVIHDLDSKVQIWDFEQGIAPVSITENQRAVKLVADGEHVYVVTQDDHQIVRLVDVQTGEIHFELLVEFPLDDAAYDPAGFLTIKGEQSRWEMWNIISGQQIYTASADYMMKPDEYPPALWIQSLSPDGYVLAAHYGFPIDNEGALELWREEQQVLAIDHVGFINHLIFSSKTPLLAVAVRATLSEGDNSVELWDTTNGTLVRKLSGHLSGVESVVFSTDGTLIASAGFDNTVRIWGIEGDK